MDFALSSEQEMIVETVRGFVETELYPLEEEIERTGEVAPEAIVIDMQVGSMGGMAIVRACKNAMAAGTIASAPLVLLLEVDEVAHARADALHLGEAPAAEVMAHGDDARLDAFGHPGAVHEVPDLGFHFKQFASLDVQSIGVRGVDPDRVFMADFI